MNIKETKSYTMMFSEEDVKMIDSLIREQVGDCTINRILNAFSCVFDYYCTLLNLIRKVCQIGCYNSYGNDEIRVLTDILSKAYNDGNHEQYKGRIKEICDAIDGLRIA